MENHALEVIITSITSIIVALIGTGVFRRYQEKQNENLSKNKLLKQLKIDELIHYSLREMRRQYNADRIYIMQFHNGGNFFSNSPIQKMSVTYERCSDGLERISSRFQNIFVSNHTWYINLILNDQMFFTNIDDIEDITTRGLLRSSGCQSQVAVPILDKTGHLIGVLVLDWVFSEIPQEYLNGVDFTEEFKETVKREANSIMNQIIP